MLAAYDVRREPIMLAVTPIDGDWAVLRYFRIIGAGEVILVEDTHGKGHCSKAIEGKLRHSIFVPIE